MSRLQADTSSRAANTVGTRVGSFTLPAGTRHLTNESRIFLGGRQRNIGGDGRRLQDGGTLGGYATCAQSTPDMEFELISGMGTFALPVITFSVDVLHQPADGHQRSHLDGQRPGAWHARLRRGDEHDQHHERALVHAHHPEH